MCTHLSHTCQRTKGVIMTPMQINREKAFLAEGIESAKYMIGDCLVCLIDFMCV